MEALLLLPVFLVSALPLCSSQQYNLAYQLLYVSPLEAHLLDAAAPMGGAAQESPLLQPSALWHRGSAQDDNNNATKLALRLIHRDSPYSPLANLQAAPQQLLLHRLFRDESRAAALSRRAELASARGLGSDGNLGQDNAAPKKKKGGSGGAGGGDGEGGGGGGGGAGEGGFSSPLSSGFAQGSGEYFIRLGVGTPPKYTNLVVDTGSDVMWIQCMPCLDCYEQADPVFDPAASSSFRRLSCKAPVCDMLQLHGCGEASGQCLYQVAYGDGSFTAGDLAAEVLRFGGGEGGRQEAMAATVALGCGHDNEGLFAGAAGLFGLGGGPLSFPSQVGRLYSRVFSYCLMDRDREGYSTLEFGGRGEMLRGTMYTPMIRNAKLDTFYYVSMIGISVGGQLLSIPETAFRIDGSGRGGVILDSGTSVSRLAEVAYGPLRSAFKEATRGLLFIGGYWPFDTCYDLSGRPTARVPTLSLHFQGEAVMALPASNYFIPVDSMGTYCLAFASTTGDLSILGNIQQQGFRVIFDRASSRVGFVPDQC